MDIKNSFAIYHIRKLQNRYKELKKLRVSNKKQFDRIKNISLKMLINLSSLQQKKIFSETPGHYNLILEKLKTHVLKLKKIPTNMRFKDNLYKIQNELEIISNKIKECMNHISPKKFCDIITFLTDDSYFSYFYDNDMIDFIDRMFCGIMVWHSKIHKTEIKLAQLNITQKKTQKIDNNILSTLLGGKSNKLTSIIKNINENKKEFNKTSYRKNNWRNFELMNKVSDSKKIVFGINPYASSLLEELNGIVIFMKYYDDFIVIQGYLQDDILSIMQDHPMIKNKLQTIKKFINYNNVSISNYFRNNFLNILTTKEILTSLPREVSQKLTAQFEDYQILITKPLLVLVNDFLLASKTRKKDILLCLLLSETENKRLAAVLFDTLKKQAKTNLAEQIYLGLPVSLRTELDTETTKQTEVEEKLSQITESDMPYEKRISLLKVDDMVKSKAMDKLKSMKNNFQGDSKASTWLDGLLKIPFGLFRESPILTFKQKFINDVNKKYNTKLNSERSILKLLKDKNNRDMIESWNGFKKDSQKYLTSVRGVLDKAVFGHNEAKTQIQRVIGQWINGNVKGAVLGLQGPPGTGKTSLAVKGLSRCLKDADGKPRPFAFLPIGGSANGSTLVGHNYTYVGSTWGRIVDILMTSKCMNPIIFIDEVDKVSRTEHGREIVSILTHLTDPTQNHEFEDKYFSGIKFDLSKALIVFSFNDVNLIDPILKDRITIIDTHPLTLPEKIHISNNFVIPEMLTEIGFGLDEVKFTEDIIIWLIETYTFEAGVRKLKEKYYEILREINLQKIFQNKDFPHPYIVEKQFIEELFQKKPKMRVKTIHKEPAVGLVNGLYATSAGIGGLTVIQVMKHACDKNLDISMTGKQGEVMKESINYAFKIAFSLLSPQKQQELINQEQKWGLHVHTPEAATPKDGPSAGAAITLAFYSVLTGKKINNKVAMTGEIDLLQNVTAIGGLGAKLLGAKRAGATKVLIPEENFQDLERLRKEGISPEDEQFKVIPVNHFSQVLKESIIEDTQDMIGFLENNYDEEICVNSNNVKDGW